MIRVSIAAPPRAYEALIENGLLAGAGERLHKLLGPRNGMFVVTSPRVRKLWGKKLLASLRASGFTPQVLEMADGEPNKKLATVEALAEKLARLRADRDAAILAFGGGVVGDTAGLLASLYMRGVDLVQIPTTVQAQLDAAIGGKTGVNLRAGKNLVGTFHQPRAVLIDPEVLSTLPDREFRSGLYEALKCGVIGNPKLFGGLERVSPSALRDDPHGLEWVIAESVRLKAQVVSADERENGLRRVLNFGHTVGHALEAATGYRHFLHGEAVAWGMVAAAHIAVQVNKLDPGIGDRIGEAVLGFGPLPGVEVRSQPILRLLQSDKKTRGGVVHFVLPREIGKVEVANDVPANAVVEAVNVLRQLSK